MSKIAPVTSTSTGSADPAAGVAARSAEPRAGITRIACVGASTIGASWAAAFLFHGLDVVAVDPAPEREAFVRRYVASAWPLLASLGPAAAGASPDRLRFEHALEGGVAGAELVQESAPEREDLKTTLFQRVDAALPPSVVIASSSSGLLLTRLQAQCAHPERFVVGHPFNPPHLIPLVEVVGGDRTSRATIDLALAFYRGIGKRPIHVRREVKGHIANRLQAALYREAVHLVAEGVASVEDVDVAIAAGPGLRWALMGPHLALALAGGEGGMARAMEHFGPGIQERWDELGHPRLTPALDQQLVEGVADEIAGRSLDDIAARRDRALVEILRVVDRAGLAVVPARAR
jgi:3-hydroxyacyl-CoA dehydrogenase